MIIVNLNTVEDSLRKVFADAGELRTVTIARKKAPAGKKEEKSLSMGYGFVEFKRKDDALKALKNLQDVSVDGHALSLKLSHRQAPSASSGAAAQEESTIKAGRAKKPEASDAVISHQTSMCHSFCLLIIMCYDCAATESRY
jgi:RNA recognition motif-containing protein